MIVYECPNPTEEIQEYLDVMESFAYRILRYQHPTWHSVLEEDVVELLREEGIHAYIEED